MGVTVALIVLGLAILLVSGDLLVRGAVALARALNVPALIVSLTIVAFGTSAPELVVTVQAVLSGNSGIALGNIVGSNIANVLLVLGLPAVIYPISAHVPGLPRHAAVMTVATLAFAAVAYSGYGASDGGAGVINFPIGAVFFTVIVAYVVYMGLRARGSDDPMLDDVDEYADGGRLNVLTLIFLVAGLVGLPLGANLLVTYGGGLAANLGVRDELIGLTVIAFGTSLPELATVVAAAVHKKSDVAIGGVVGSNIFNLLAVGGAAGLAGGAAFDEKALTLDLPVMLAATAALLAFILLRRDIGRIAGAIFFIAYCLFIAVLAQSSGVM
ncbi:MAG: calcium/sodium antiporter [Pseudomonadota bacterium]